MPKAVFECNDSPEASIKLIDSFVGKSPKDILSFLLGSKEMKDLWSDAQLLNAFEYDAYNQSVVCEGEIRIIWNPIKGVTAFPTLESDAKETIGLLSKKTGMVPVCGFCVQDSSYPFRTMLDGQLSTIANLGKTPETQKNPIVVSSFGCYKT